MSDFITTIHDIGSLKRPEFYNEQGNIIIEENNNSEKIQKERKLH